MKKFTKMLVVIALILGISAIQAIAGPGTVTVKLLDSNGNGVEGATVNYFKSGAQLFGVTNVNGEVTGYIDVEGTTTIHLIPENGGTRIWLNVDPATVGTLTEQMVAVTIDLKTCAGTSLVGEALYYKSGWKSLGATPVTVDLLPYTGLGPGQGSYDFRMKYDGRTSQTLRQDISVSAAVNFNTTRVDFAYDGPIQYYNSGWKTFVGPKEMIGGTENFGAENIGRAEFRFGSPVVLQKYIDITGCSVSGALIRLVDENNAPLANLDLGNMLTYKSRCGGSWTYSGVPFQTDANGYSLLNTSCAANNWDGKITVSVNKTSKEQVVATNSTYQVAPVNVTLKTCEGLPLAGGTVHQGSGSWTPRGTTDASGKISFYAFPGTTVVARMTYNYGSLTQNNVPVVLPVTDIDFVTTKVTLYGNNIQIQTGGWPAFTSPMELLTGTTYNFRFNGIMVNGVNITGCEMNQALLHVKDELNQPVEGASFRIAKGGSWLGWVGNTDANGYYFGDVLGELTKINAKVGNSSQELTKAQLNSSNYTWVTEVLRVYLKDQNDAPITDELGSLQQGGGTWIALGNFNASGYVDVATFPVTSARYRATYKSWNDTQDGIPVVAGAGIQQFDFICPNPETKSGTFASLDNGITPEFSYKLYPVPANSRLNVHTTLIADEQVEYQVFDLTGRTMKNGIWKLNRGFNTNVIELNDLVEGQYIFKLKTSGKVITEKFSINKN